MEAAKKTFVIVLWHFHTDDVDSSRGRIQAADTEEALRKSALWIARQKRERGCRRRGNTCEVVVKEAHTSVKYTMLAASAEDIA